MYPNSILSRDFSEQQWVDQVSKNFDDHDVTDVPVCVFGVPKATRRFKPEAYVPIAIALGPYHHFETHLYQMERFKVAAVKAILTADQVVAFESLVIDRLVENEPMIRACYHKYMDLHIDTLAWIFAIDGVFLIGLLKHYVDLSNLMPKKMIHDGVLFKDVMVLENQIPLCLLNEIWKALCHTSTVHNRYDDRELISMLRKFCEVHSPLKLAKDFDYRVETGCLHLLDLMYHLIINNQDTPQPLREAVLKIANDDNIIEKLEDRPISVAKNIPWEKITNLLGLKISKQDNEEGEEGKDRSIVADTAIPSVSSLTKHAQINFCRTDGGIRDIKFNESKRTLYLPVITLEDYSEVMLRNLMAYEMATSCSTRELARYVELMSGIVDTGADVKLLRDKSIIKGNMKDKEIVDMLCGMSKGSFYKGRNKTLEQVIEYYNSRPLIRTWRFVKKDLICSQKVASVVLAVLASLLMILYSFCEVYGCSRSSPGSNG